MKLTKIKNIYIQRGNHKNIWVGKEKKKKKNNNNNNNN